jgi:hypothetical protein
MNSQHPSTSSGSAATASKESSKRVVKHKLVSSKKVLANRMRRKIYLYLFMKLILFKI